MTLLDEIREQPHVAVGLLAAQSAHIQTIAAALRTREIRGVMIAARGTSDHAAIYVQYLFGAFHRLPAWSISTSTIQPAPGTGGNRTPLVLGMRVGTGRR
jgi:glucosamine--fructose-6-phosphate aminotransferase (isomerizing)